MYYGASKVYFDGSHYIAIPHTEKRNQKRRHSTDEEEITVKKEQTEEGSMAAKTLEPSVTINEEAVIDFEEVEDYEFLPFQDEEPSSTTTTKKAIFEELYTKHISLKVAERKKIIFNEMLSYFDNETDCNEFIERNFERKKRNLIVRRIRMCRKANLAGFNFFCTFTYDNKKHNEQTFKKTLRACFRNFCYRHKWTYMGVWERAPKTNRLHFHGLFKIPDTSVLGKITKVRSYDTNSHSMQISYQSEYFNNRFGRSDFKEIAYNDKDLGNELAYLMKYIEKTGEKIVYSKGLPQYFISDILEDDIVCNTGLEDRKLLLFDDFRCLNDGELMGTVCPEVIEQMRKCN